MAVDPVEQGVFLPGAGVRGIELMRDAGLLVSEFELVSDVTLDNGVNGLTSVSDCWLPLYGLFGGAPGCSWFLSRLRIRSFVSK